MHSCPAAHGAQQAARRTLLHMPTPDKRFPCPHRPSPPRPCRTFGHNGQQEEGASLEGYESKQLGRRCLKAQQAHILTQLHHLQHRIVRLPERLVAWAVKQSKGRWRVHKVHEVHEVHEVHAVV